MIERGAKLSEVFISSTAQGCDLSPGIQRAKSSMCLANSREVLDTATVSGREAHTGHDSTPD